MTIATEKTKSKAKTKPESKVSERKTNPVIGLTRAIKKYTLGEDYAAWKEHCDSLKVQSQYHGSEATRLRNLHKKAYDNGAEGFLSERDEQAWAKANNLLTIAELKENERANAWKLHKIDKLDLPPQLKELANGYFYSLGEMSEWLNKIFREKKKGLGPGAVEKLIEALSDYVAPYHEPIIQAELELAKNTVTKLSK